MKALSLWQPWASYVAVGMKRFETRHWTTRYRGPLAIHAAARKLTADERSLLAAYPLPIGSGEMPFGAIVATAELVGVFEMPDRDYDISEQEETLGNWAPGRFAWDLRNVVRLPEPVPAKGAQGFWEWEARA